MDLIGAAKQKRANPNECWVHKLDPELRKAFAEVEAMHDRGESIHQDAVRKALNDAQPGLDLYSDAVGRHLRGNCQCRS